MKSDLQEATASTVTSGSTSTPGIGVFHDINVEQSLLDLMKVPEIYH